MLKKCKHIPNCIKDKLKNSIGTFLFFFFNNPFFSV